MTGEGRYPLRPERGDWTDRAACSGAPGTPLEGWSKQDRLDLFFPPANRPGNSGEARRVCAVCPVRDECAADAIANREEHGVRAGMTVRELRARLVGQPLLRFANASCGTEAGYKRHLRRDEAPCWGCRLANTEVKRLRDGLRGVS